MKDTLARKFKKLDSDTLMASLRHHASEDEPADWRNWGDNPLRQMAEEAHQRGLLK